MKMLKKMGNQATCIQGTQPRYPLIPIIHSPCAPVVPCLKPGNRLPSGVQRRIAWSGVSGKQDLAARLAFRSFSPLNPNREPVRRLSCLQWEQSSYLNEEVLCEEAIFIFIHTELNYCVHANVTSFPFRNTRQRFLEKQPLRSRLNCYKSLNWSVFWWSS